jgi:hypothetical protein
VKKRGKVISRGERGGWKRFSVWKRPGDSYIHESRASELSCSCFSASLRLKKGIVGVVVVMRSVGVMGE